MRNAICLNSQAVLRLFRDKKVVVNKPVKKGQRVCEYGSKGCLLWVKEGFKIISIKEQEILIYKADLSACKLSGLGLERSKRFLRGKWRSSMIMPRWASRAVVKVKGVELIESCGKKSWQISLNFCSK